jgi:hypothetical protein
MQNIDLRLNFIPIAFNGQSFKGSEMPYVDEEHLKKLRVQYQSSHVFRRNGNAIQCVPLTESAEILGTEKTFKVNDDFSLAKYLVQNALINVPRQENRFNKLFYPTKLVRENENRGRSCGDEKVHSVLKMYPEYEISKRHNSLQETGG